MLLRKQNWQLLLHEYLRTCRAREFHYGAFDCCLFVCDAIHAMTGVDVASPLREKYGSRKQAFRAIAKYAGHPSVQAVTERVTADHRMPEISPSLAQRGDVALITRNYDFSLALVGLDGGILAAGARGYERVPPLLAVRAWRV